MADGSKISWTDATWNVINGCKVLSPGCTNCYAMKLAGGRMQNHPTRSGLTKPSKAGPVWNGEVKFIDQAITQPLHWHKPRMIFVNAHGDTFYDRVPFDWVDRIVAVMALAHWHTFQILSKRSGRQRSYFTALKAGDRDDQIALHMTDILKIRSGGKLRSSDARWFDDAMGKLRTGPLANVWIGISAEDQKRYGERIADLHRTPAALRWVSLEPLLGPIKFETYDLAADPCFTCQHADDLGKPRESYSHPINCRWRRPRGTPDHAGIDWVVTGGESGAGARPCNPDWVRSIRDQCAEAGVPFHHKQWGEWLPGEVYAKPADAPAADPEHLMGGFTRFPDLEAGQIADPEFRGVPTHWWSGDSFGGKISARVGKGISGNLLDGVKHEAFP